MISISYLDGRRLSRAVIAGAHFVGERAEPLNKINVFPVPDGDTGTNLATTLQKVAAGVARLKERHVRRMSTALADEALAGARGNSGAILAQFLTGFCEGLPDRARISTGDFGAAVLKAADSAYGAMARPVEGTILTVIRDWARAVADRAKDVRLAGANGIDAAMITHRLDALLFPGASGASIAARPGYPTVIVPFGQVPNAPTPKFPDTFAAKPSPYGVAFTGMACSEPRLIALAYAFEQATKRRVPPGLERPN